MSGPELLDVQLTVKQAGVPERVTGFWHGRHSTESVHLLRIEGGLRPEQVPPTPVRCSGDDYFQQPRVFKHRIEALVGTLPCVHHGLPVCCCGSPTPEILAHRSWILQQGE